MATAATAAAVATPLCRYWLQVFGKTSPFQKFFLTVNINSIHDQVNLLANEPEVNVVDSQDFLLASGARVCKSCDCKKLLLRLGTFPPKVGPRTLAGVADLTSHRHKTRYLCLVWGFF